MKSFIRFITPFAIIAMLIIPPINVSAQSNNLIETPILLNLSENQSAQYDYVMNIYNESEVITNNQTYQPFIDNQTSKGKLVCGAAIPSILQINNISGWCAIGSSFTIQNSWVSNGISEMWIRIPVYIQNVDLRIQIYHVGSRKIADIDHVIDNEYFRLSNRSEASQIYNKTFFDGTTYPDIYQTNELIDFNGTGQYYNFTYINVQAPFYGGYRYYMVISFDPDGDPFQLYPSENDIGDDQYTNFTFAYKSGSWNITRYPIDLDTGFYFIYGLGANVAANDIEANDTMFFQYISEKLTPSDYISLFVHMINISDSWCRLDLYNMHDQGYGDGVSCYNINNRNFTKSTHLTDMHSNGWTVWNDIGASGTAAQKIRLNYSDLLNCGDELRFIVNCSYAGEYQITIMETSTTKLITNVVMASENVSAGSGINQISVSPSILFDRATNHVQINDLFSEWTFYITRNDAYAFKVAMANVSGNASHSGWYDQYNCTIWPNDIGGNPYCIWFWWNISDVSSAGYDHYDKFILLSERMGEAYYNGEYRYQNLDIPGNSTDWIIRIVTGTDLTFYTVDRNHEFDLDTYTKLFEVAGDNNYFLQSNSYNVIKANGDPLEKVFFYPHFTLHRTSGKWINAVPIVYSYSEYESSILNPYTGEEFTPYKLIARWWGSFTRNAYGKVELYLTTQAFTMGLFGPLAGYYVGNYIYRHWVYPVSEGRPPDGPLYQIAAEALGWVWDHLVDFGEWLWMVAQKLYGYFTTFIDWLELHSYDIMVFFTFVIAMLSYGLFVYFWIKFGDFWVKVGTGGISEGGEYAVNLLKDTEELVKTAAGYVKRGD